MSRIGNQHIYRPDIQFGTLECFNYSGSLGNIYDVSVDLRAMDITLDFCLGLREHFLGLPEQ